MNIRAAITAPAKSVNRPVSEADFESAALPHLGDLYRTARHVLGNQTEAEDVVQEVYLQAWKSFHRFEVGTNCRAWLYKILFHVIHHHRRKWSRWTWNSESDEAVTAKLVYEPPAPEDLSDEEVLAALARVPQSFREVVLLSDVMEFTYSEIADTLQVPIGTVMSRLHRGRKLLRAGLAGVAEAYGIQTAKRAAQVA
ncbi:MAG TPA: sigma-70 family RNA polymerase sigma factor [Blastocatellia bacterium]|nr:sigma-70 family RNA polymerase sigma factor [Blastocatellia bacterium]